MDAQGRAEEAGEAGDLVQGVEFADLAAKLLPPQCRVILAFLPLLQSHQQHQHLHQREQSLSHREAGPAGIKKTMPL